MSSEECKEVSVLILQAPSVLWASEVFRSALDRRYLREVAGALLVSELFDRADEDLGRELVILIRASSYRPERVKVLGRLLASIPSNKYSDRAGCREVSCCSGGVRALDHRR
jgi:hypothetical protein